MEAGLALLDDVASGAYAVASFNESAIAQAAVAIERYRNLDIGLTDASIVVLAERYETADVLTLDERHFRSIRTGTGRPFRLLPADG